MKAVIYARFSSEKQNEASIEGQPCECMDYANFSLHFCGQRYCAKYYGVNIVNKAYIMFR